LAETVFTHGDLPGSRRTNEDVEKQRKNHIAVAQKKSRPIDREINTAVFLLRCFQMGLSTSDLKQLSYGMVFDLMTEAGNDQVEYQELATQEDFDAFKGKKKNG
jgi:hypothetical protein